MDFVLPPLLWLGVGKRSLGWRILNWTIVIGYSGIAVAGACPQLYALDQAFFRVPLRTVFLMCQLDHHCGHTLRRSLILCA